MTERRQFIRIDLPAIVRYSTTKIIFKEKDSELITKNISAGGICTTVEKDLKIGTTLSLKIFLPESDFPITAVGKVVWTRELKKPLGVHWKNAYEIGVEFIKIEPYQQQKILEYVNEAQSYGRSKSE